MLVYSGDTGPTDALVELARGADVLLCEAAMREDEPDLPPDLHLTGGQAGEVAARAGVGRLIVTHVPPWYDRESQAAAARTTYSGQVDPAEPDHTYPV